MDFKIEGNLSIRKKFKEINPELTGIIIMELIHKKTCRQNY